MAHDLRLSAIEPAAAPARASLPRRRTLTRLAVALLAVALGWVAQDLLQQDWLWEGLLLYAAAAWLFAWQLRQAPPVETVSMHPVGDTALSVPLKLHSGGQSVISYLGLGIVGLSVTLSGVALVHFGRLDNATGWMYHLASWGVFILGVKLAATHTTAVRPADRISVSRSSWLRVDVWLLAILALALFFRLYRFHSVPFGVWYDEAVAGIEARLVWDDPNFRPVFWESMNHPAHHLYLFALSIRLFGDTIWGLRALSVAFGIGNVIMAYLLGNALHGRRWGLLLAFLVATSRWDVNFSRIAMNSISAHFFVFPTLFCAVYAWRSRLQSPGWMAATGLVLGLGLCFHTAFRLFAMAFVLFGGVLLIRQVKRWWEDKDSHTQRIGVMRQTIYSGVLFLVAVWLATAPVVQFALAHPAIFWQRTRTVSIFTNRENPDLAMALLHNIRKHALMFNYRGDPNGRHNLPGAPMLDRLSGVLFVLGLALAVARRDWASRFFLLLFPFGLAGGIFSLDFEAPQSLRSLAALPAVVYFIALSLDALWREWRWNAAIVRPRWSWLAVVLGLGMITVENAHMYFVRQANDTAVWQSFSTTETLIGMKVAELGARPIYYFSPLVYDHPTIRYLAPEHAAAEGLPSIRKVMPLPDPLPAREAGDRPVVYFVHPDEAWVVGLARQLYPTAQIVELPGTPG
ncbi:MAG: glycosyltransferase family 39 protein, partial [Anaerolineae bacterium]|nr:glycosyltransferase family 39 protein [Anaerolineae bacterium]MDW8069952.1 glycosyltransferase family 39 protein [Anaerolineae bacterium]